MSRISRGWKEALDPVLTAPGYADLRAYIKRRRDEGVKVYPESGLVFEALRQTPLETLKVVIVGQDPYHGPRQANGLAFAVGKGLPRPPSLRNIIKELQVDLGREVAPRATTLLGWAHQGVLLLNTSLTVEEGMPGSHADKGWSDVTDAILRAVAAKREPVVALLWGEHAKRKKPLLGYGVKCFEAAHPSPLSASRFFGCKHFTQANQYLVSKGVEPIDWTKIDLED